MKYWLVWGVVLLICLIVQSTLLPMLTYNGTHADLLLVVIVLASLHLGPKQGTMIGFTAGLLQDLASGSFIGMNAFLKVVTAFCLGMTKHKVFQDNVFLPLFGTGVATIANYFFGAIIMFLLGYRFNLGENILNMLVPLLIFNMVLAFPVQLLIRRFSGKSSE